MVLINHLDFQFFELTLILQTWHHQTYVCTLLYRHFYKSTDWSAR